MALMESSSLPKNIRNRLEENENALWHGKSKEPVFTAARVRVSLEMLLAAGCLPFLISRFPAELPWIFQPVMIFVAVALGIVAILPLIAKAIKPAPQYAVTNRRVLGESRLFLLFKKEWEFPITKDLIKGGCMFPDRSGSLDFSYDRNCTVNGKPVSCGFRHVENVRQIEQLLVEQGAAPLPPEEYSRQGAREGRGLLLTGISLALGALAIFGCALYIDHQQDGWTPADAVITGYVEHTSGSAGERETVWRPQLKFRTAEGDREVSTICSSPVASIRVSVGSHTRSAPTARIGQSIGILYNPENPEQVVPNNDKKGNNFAGFIKSSCFLIWAFAGLELAFALHAFKCAAKVKGIIRSCSAA